MKIDKLFKKIELFFNMKEDKAKAKEEKRKQLKSSLEKKIVSFKKKIKNTTDKNNKYILKEEIKMLKKIGTKINN